MLLFYLFLCKIKKFFLFSKILARKHWRKSFLPFYLRISKTFANFAGELKKSIECRYGSVGRAAASQAAGHEFEPRLPLSSHPRPFGCGLFFASAGVASTLQSSLAYRSRAKGLDHATTSRAIRTKSSSVSQSSLAYRSLLTRYLRLRAFLLW